MIVLRLLEQSLPRHVFNRTSALPQALDCIVSSLLIWIKRQHMSIYSSECRRYKEIAYLSRTYTEKTAQECENYLIINAFVCFPPQGTPSSGKLKKVNVVSIFYHIISESLWNKSLSNYFPPRSGNLLHHTWINSCLLWVTEWILNYNAINNFYVVNVWTAMATDKNINK